MKDLLILIVKSLVDKPDEVEVVINEDESYLHLKLHVDKTDMGKVIGKSGRIAKSIRTILKAASVIQGAKKVTLDIMEKEDSKDSEN